jgi:hypothetical protein
MKKKKIYLLLLIPILIFLVIVINKLRGPGENSGKQLSQREIEKLYTSLDEEIDVGEFIVSDIDSDGIYDNFVLTLDSK